MNMVNYRRFKIYFVVLLGLILFTAGLFWEGGPKPTWAQQGPPGTVPPAPTADPGNDDGGNHDDDDDNGRPGIPPGGGPPGGGPPGGGPRGPNLADLSLRKWVDEPLPDVGQVITYTIVISNSGPRGAYGVRVLDQLPVGVVLSDVVESRGRYNPRTGFWTVGIIRATEQLTLNLISVVTGTGRITNTAELMRAFPADPDSVPANGVPIEDEWAYAVITPTEVTTDQGEEGLNAAFIDQSRQPKSAQSSVEDSASNSADNPSQPVTEEQGLDNTEASVKAVQKPAEGFPLVWIALAGGGIGLIAAGLWLAKR